VPKTEKAEISVITLGSTAIDNPGCTSTTPLRASPHYNGAFDVRREWDNPVLVRTEPDIED
jgi:hypothetical protein